MTELATPDAHVALAKRKLLEAFQELHQHGWTRKKMPTVEVELVRETKVVRAAWAKRPKGALASAAAALIVVGSVLLLAGLPAGVVALGAGLTLAGPAVMFYVRRPPKPVTVEVSLRVAYAYTVASLAIDDLVKYSLDSTMTADAMIAFEELEDLVLEATRLKAQGETQRRVADRMIESAAELHALATMARQRVELFIPPEEAIPEVSSSPRLRASIASLAQDLADARLTVDSRPATKDAL